MRLLIHLGLAIPVEGKPIEDAGLVVDGALIKDVGPWLAVRRRHPKLPTLVARDLVAVPGFVNAHAHLELTGLRGKIRFDGDFTDWVRQILIYKKHWEKPDFDQQIDRGIAELVDGGCTTVGDHSTMGYSADRMERAGVRGTSFIEVVQFDPRKQGPLREATTKFLKGRKTSRVQRGIAVHAPYSVSGEFTAWAARRKVPLSTHMSELKEELDFIAHDNAKNPFRLLLEQRGMWNEDWTAPHTSPPKYFHKLGFKDYAAVHANYPRPGDAQVLHKHSAGVVYCPLSHKYFRHPKHPLASYLKKGLTVGLGTDSCASNDTLDMRAEMAHVKKVFRSIPDARILEMATMGGAGILGLEKQVGSLKKGKRADIAFFQLPLNPGKALSSIVSQRPPVRALMCEGRWLKGL